eukprot:TRINITY_DN113458_c0_g1_i1.p1 TRINITY_DN113458_c0_g1~~TRINITY_DN113458_c0_g1_i1.p1  ORF type:complete len:447 (-),score=23.80 TRINITY_DN113458_c0_g1_i1:73-1413(-)
MGQQASLPQDVITFTYQFLEAPKAYALRAVCTDCLYAFADIESLELSDSNNYVNLPKNWAKTIVNELTNLHTLRIKGQWPDIAGIARSCPTLLNLEIVGCTRPGLTSGLCTFAAHATNLRSLRIRSCRDSDEGLSSLFTNCTHIESVSISNGLNEMGGYNPGRLAAAMSSMAKLKNLKVLRIEKMGILYDNALVKIAQTCPTLEEVDLRDEMITAESLEAIANHCKALQTFSATLPSQVDKGKITLGMQHITKECNQLKKLVFAGLPDPCLVNLAQHCQHLEILELTCPATAASDAFLDLSDNGIAALAQGCRKLKTFKCANLRHIGDSGMAGFIHEHPNLEGLWLGNTSVGDETCAAIGDTLKKLRKLSLRDCTEVTRNGLQSVITNCTAIERLWLGGTDMTDRLVDVVITNCPLLKEITVQDTLVGKKSLRKLADAFPALGWAL